MHARLQMSVSVEFVIVPRCAVLVWQTSAASSPMQLGAISNCPMNLPSTQMKGYSP